MKKLILYFIYIFLFFCPKAHAHTLGHPAFIKINDTYTKLYPVLSTSLKNISLPQDIASESYVINTRIRFQVETTRLLLPAYIAKEALFYWDFGDGQQEEGVSIEHLYTRIGSYILTLRAKDVTSPKPQLLDTVRLDILPNSQYKLPVSIIKVNGQVSSDPIVDIITLSFDLPIHFDARASTAVSSRIVSYIWDLGDSQKAQTPILSHRYNNNLHIIFPF